MAIGWNQLFYSGSVIDLNVGSWGARIQIKAADLGIEDSEEVRQALSLGSHRLVPREALDGINKAANQAQRAVDYHSLNFALIRGARYVPDATLPDLLDKLRGFKATYDKEVAAFIASYAETKAKMLPIIEKALRDAARSPEAAAAALDRISAEYPAAEKVRDRFKLSWSIYAIQGAKSAAAAEAAEDEAETVKDVMREMVTQLRDELGGKLKGILDLINKGGSLKEQSLKSAYETLDRVESLNVLGDSALAEQVRAMRVALRDIEAGRRVSDGTVAGLEQVKQALAASVEEAVAEAEKNLTAVGRRKLKG